jgi:hypothetical protein
MFTANSMNCLTEALGLSLPGNGTLVATHADRKRLFLEAGSIIVGLARRWYEEEDATVLPRAIASFGAFENAMALDIAMGGSTNTVLHLLAAAHEAGDIIKPVRAGLFSMDELSGTLGQLLLGEVVGRRRDKDITVFKSVGLAVQDAAAAVRALARAEVLGLGVDVRF